MERTRASPRTRAAEATVRIGISGWRYAPWRGVFYPAGLAQRRELKFASRMLPTIEINGSFYSLQRPEFYARWRDETPPGFVFAVKGSRYVTHLRLKDVATPLANFFASGLPALGDKLGPILWQLPPSLPFDAARLDTFLARPASSTCACTATSSSMPAATATPRSTPGRRACAAGARPTRAGPDAAFVPMAAAALSWHRRLDGADRRRTRAARCHGHGGVRTAARAGASELPAVRRAQRVRHGAKRRFRDAVLVPRHHIPARPAGTRAARRRRTRLHLPGLRRGSGRRLTPGTRPARAPRRATPKEARRRWPYPTRLRASRSTCDRSARQRSRRRATSRCSRGAISR